MAMREDEVRVKEMSGAQPLPKLSQNPPRPLPAAESDTAILTFLVAMLQPLACYFFYKVAFYWSLSSFFYSCSYRKWPYFLEAVVISCNVLLSIYFIRNRRPWTTIIIPLVPITVSAALIGLSFVPVNRDWFSSDESFRFIRNAVVSLAILGAVAVVLGKSVGLSASERILAWAISILLVSPAALELIPPAALAMSITVLRRTINYPRKYGGRGWAIAAVIISTIYFLGYLSIIAFASFCVFVGCMAA
jgi:hypothetical protein